MTQGDGVESSPPKSRGIPIVWYLTFKVWVGWETITHENNIVHHPHKNAGSKS